MEDLTVKSFIDFKKGVIFLKKILYLCAAILELHAVEIQESNQSFYKRTDIMRDVIFEDKKMDIFSDIFNWSLIKNTWIIAFSLKELKFFEYFRDNEFMNCSNKNIFQEEKDRFIKALIAYDEAKVLSDEKNCLQEAISILSKLRSYC